MEQKKTSSIKFAMTYGLYVGLASIVYSVVLYFAGISLNSAASNLGLLILILGIGISVKNYRDLENGGFLEFGEGFKIGVLVSMFSGVFSSFYQLIFMKFIDPSILDKMKDMYYENAIEKGMSEAQLSQMDGMMGIIYNPFVLFLAGILSSLIFGALISLVAAAILKKKGDAFENIMSNIEE